MRRANGGLRQLPNLRSYHFIHGILDGKQLCLDLPLQQQSLFLDEFLLGFEKACPNRADLLEKVFGEVAIEIQVALWPLPRPLPSQS